MNRPALAAVAALLLVLTACAAPEPTPTKPPVAEPSATPTPIALEVPQPLLLAECDDLVSVDTYAALSTTALSAADPARSSLNEYSFGINPEFTLQQLQATQCLWQNDAPREDEYGSSNAYSSLTIVALPDADAAWESYTQLYELSAPEPVSCNGADSENARCWWTGMLANSVWVDLVFTGMKNAGSDAANVAAFSPLVTEVVKNLGAADRGKLWTKPTGETTISRGCPSVLSADAIASALGAAPKDVHFYRGPIGGTALVFEAEIIAGSDPCRWSTPRTEAEYGLPVQVLEGGAWAWDAARAIDPTARDASEVALAGLLDGESAWLRTGSKIPSIDVIVDGSWISVALYPETVASLKVDADATLTKLAQGILDELRP